MHIMNRLLFFILFFSPFTPLFSQTDSVKIEIYPNAKNLVIGYENRVKIIAPEKYDQNDLTIFATGCKVVKNKRENTYLIRVPKEMLNKDVTIYVRNNLSKEENELLKVMVKAIAFDNTVRKVTK